MELHECKIGTLVYQEGYPQFIGHIIGMEYVPVLKTCVPIVRWPTFMSDYERNLAKADHPCLPWLHLGYEESSINAANLHPL